MHGSGLFHHPHPWPGSIYEMVFHCCTTLLNTFTHGLLFTRSQQSLLSTSPLEQEQHTMQDVNRTETAILTAVVECCSAAGPSTMLLCSSRLRAADIFLCTCVHMQRRLAASHLYWCSLRAQGVFTSGRTCAVWVLVVVSDQRSVLSRFRDSDGVLNRRHMHRLQCYGCAYITVENNRMVQLQRCACCSVACWNPHMSIFLYMRVASYSRCTTICVCVCSQLP